MNYPLFPKRIIDWYESNHRRLPWRATRDAYKIWLSEIILQQTRVSQGLPYYEAFVKTFPTVFDLAKAPQQKVLRLWQGLGYYSRARNLHACAKVLVKNSNGKFPTTFEELKKLPGIGPYTAAAIASMAFHEKVAVVDGNVFRVLSRVFGIDKDIASEDGKKYFFAMANRLIDSERPDLFNQAIMEFGALHCTPKTPKCHDCIFSKNCEANQRKMQSELPVKSKKQTARVRHLNYFVIKKGNQTFLRHRREKDIWKGLYDFYLIESPRKSRPEILISQDKILAQSKIIRPIKAVTHVLSHQKLNIKFVEVEKVLSKKDEAGLKKLGLKKFTKSQTLKLPKPVPIDRFLVADS